MPKLSQDRKEILKLADMTYADVGREIGMHRNIVAEIEKKALDKLRAGLEMRGYKLEDFFK
jgi:hypothetical protein